MKLKLDNDLMIEDFFENARLLGIVAPIPDYRFIWHINQTMGYGFRLNHDSEIPLIRKKRNYFFEVYDFKISGSSLVHYLYNNHDDGEYLLPEFKHLDYLWLTKGEVVSNAELTVIKEGLKKISAVQLVNEMTNEKIKNKEHLIL